MKIKTLFSSDSWLLVEREIFEAIEIAFLPVGHTHNQLDGWFGRIARQVDQLNNSPTFYIRTMSVKTRDELMERIRRTQCDGTEVVDCPLPDAHRFMLLC